jgi:hypothetical protein
MSREPQFTAGPGNRAVRRAAAIRTGAGRAGLAFAALFCQRRRLIPIELDVA